MNVFKLSCCLVTTVVISGFMHAMEEQACLKLSTIEKQLILREVEKRGKDNMLGEIHKEKQQSAIQYDETSNLCFFYIPFALKIRKTFYKADVENDPLTKNVFDAIHNIERLEGEGLNCPEYDYGREVESDEYLLGKKTHYQWINSDFTKVRIQSQFDARPYEQKALENVVNSYNQ